MQRVIATGLIVLMASYAAFQGGRYYENHSEGHSRSILVGTGCEGEWPIAVATEEDRLPVCASIERHALH